MSIRNVLISIFCMNFLLVEVVSARSACIIIHGTWAKYSSWYRHGGTFYQEIEKSLANIDPYRELVTFRWSGLLGDLAQKQAACELLAVLDEYDDVIIVAHSHGATVGILASMLLGSELTASKYFGKITKFYALGVPVDGLDIIYPDMNVIKHFYNLFSFGDLVQRVHGLYERRFKPHPCLTNISVKIDDMCPSHRQLHHQIIGKYLLYIPEFYQQHRLENFEKFQHGVPAEIVFSKKNTPVYQPDPDQDRRIQVDRLAFELTQKAFFRSPKKHNH